MRVLSAVALALFLAGCGGTTGTDMVAKVQEATKQACGFVPLASTVAAILDAVGGTGGSATSVTSIASGVCAAMTAPKLRAYGDRPTYEGVPLEGDWVK